MKFFYPKNLSSQKEIFEKGINIIHFFAVHESLACFFSQKASPVCYETQRAISSVG